ncbi:Fanconi anemia group B protein [Arvicola amphibius]|uniref:Fanconi anemia group B protein n=1 Tax=Arvicola amphibius TaxID=1047088 RepID=UPI0018E38950|nr:Fanconi anemia group B protein [Arvicola amphibius]
MAGNQAMPLNEQAKFLCYNGEVLVFHLSKDDFEDCEMPTDTSALYVKRMIFDREKGTFVLISTGFLSIKEKASHLKILCCKCVSDFKTRINLPCILIQYKKYNSRDFRYCILFLHNLNKFEKHLSFTLNHALDESLKIFDGPIIFWQYLNKFFYISSQIGEVTNISVTLSSVEWVGEIENFGVGFLGLAEPPAAGTHKFSESDYEFSDSNLCAYDLKTQQKLSTGYLIPLAYSTIVTHVHVRAAEMVDNQLRMALIALTQKNQLILFQDGIPIRVCQLPFVDPCSVQILDSGKRNRFFIVSFNSKACAVSEKKFKVVAKWEQLSLVLINDFVGVGTDQLLVLFDAALNTDQLTSFAITDFVRINFSTEPLDCIEDPFAEEEHENYYLVLPALEAQLEASFVFRNKLQKHISLKDKFIANSWKILLNSIYGNIDITSNDEEDELVPFCDEDENSIHTPEEKLSEHFQEPQHIVKQTWCRVLDDDLVIGLKVTSLNPSSNEMTLSLIMDQSNRSTFQLLKCQSQVTRLSMYSFPEADVKPVETGPETKRIKLTCGSKEEENSCCEQLSKIESTHVITAATSLSPLLVFNKLCCTLLLNISDRDSVKNTVHDYVICGSLDFNLQDLFSTNHLLAFPKKQSIEHTEDLVLLLAALHKYCFLVTSPTHAPNLMKIWLLKHMKCEIINGFREIYLYKMLRNCGALFSWEPRTTFEGILTVYCRNEGALFHCLDQLIRVLPERCFFSYLRLGNEAFLMGHCLSTLEKELVTFCSLSTSAFEYARDGAMPKTNETNSPAAASEEEDKICLHKQEVQRERMIKDLNLKVNGSSYVQMTLALAETQLKSDLITEKLANL